MKDSEITLHFAMKGFEITLQISVLPYVVFSRRDIPHHGKHNFIVMTTHFVAVYSAATKSSALILLPPTSLLACQLHVLCFCCDSGDIGRRRCAKQ